MRCSVGVGQAVHPGAGVCQGFDNAVNLAAQQLQVCIPQPHLGAVGGLAVGGAVCRESRRRGCAAGTPVGVGNAASQSSGSAGGAAAIIGVCCPPTAAGNCAVPVQQHAAPLLLRRLARLRPLLLR
jgi:hypothetical protein